MTFFAFGFLLIAYRTWRARNLRENHVIHRIPEARVVSAPELEEGEKTAEEEGPGEGGGRRGTGGRATRSIMMAEIVPMNMSRRGGRDGGGRDGRGDRGGGDGGGGEAGEVLEMHVSMAVEEVVEEAVAVAAPTAQAWGHETDVQVAVAEEQVFVEV